jgi:hypothetical protein
MVPQSFHHMGDEGKAAGYGMTGGFAVPEIT